MLRRKGWAVNAKRVRRLMAEMGLKGKRLKDGLCPKLDQILPAFLDDMTARGLLDETLVLVISEHGRTPTLSNTPGGGREHWAGAYWGMFFGAGIKTGQVIGATDRLGAYPVSHPTHPNDILATVYHLLGFDPQVTTIPDRSGRPMRLTEGIAVRELLV
jgi:arylsulfatase A-like enzyme